MPFSLEKRMEHHPANPGAPAGSEEVLLPGPVHGVRAAAVGGTGGGRVDHRLLAFKGVIEAVGFEQVTPGEFASPFLQKGGLAGRSHHAAHLVAGLQGSTGDLTAEGACGADDQNLHPPLSCNSSQGPSLGVRRDGTRTERARPGAWSLNP